jgi:hypothetical protein
MTKLNDLIQVYDETLDPSVCDFLINVLESSQQLQLNLTDASKNSEEINNVHNHIISKVFEYKKQYYEFIDDRCFPEQHNFEKFHIQKFRINEDYVAPHVEVQDHESARRFLAFKFFLNTVEQGGETAFSDFRVYSKKGSLLVFPPLWPFPYKEEIPINCDKYLLTCFLHYK